MRAKTLIPVHSPTTVRHEAIVPVPPAISRNSATAAAAAGSFPIRKNTAAVTKAPITIKQLRNTGIGDTKGMPHGIPFHLDGN